MTSVTEKILPGHEGYHFKVPLPGRHQLKVEKEQICEHMSEATVEITDARLFVRALPAQAEAEETEEKGALDELDENEVEVIGPTVGDAAERER